MKITVPYPPTTNHLYVNRADGKGRVPAKATKVFKETCQWLFVAAKLRPLAKPQLVALTLHVYRPRRQGDLSNTLKALEDALKGFGFEDDEQVAEIHMYRHEDPKNPRATVEVVRLEIETQEAETRQEEEGL